MVAFAQQITGPGWSEGRTGPAESARPVPAAEPARRTPDGYGAAMLRQRLVARAVTKEVLPRLVLNHATPPVTPALGWSPTREDVAELAALVIGPDETLPVAFVGAMREHGATLEQIYLDLLTPAARLLGVQWDDDDIDILHLTHGLGRLQRIVHELSPHFLSGISRQGNGRPALMLAAPGEQHTLALSMIAEFFRRGGWDVWSDPAATHAQMADMAHENWYAVVGFTMDGSGCLDALAGAIHAVKRASRNRAVRMLVCGPVFIAHPELASLVGADAAAADGRHAVMQAQNLLSMLPGRD